MRGGIRGTLMEEEVRERTRRRNWRSDERR